VRDHAVVLDLILTGPSQGPDGRRPEHVFQVFRLAGGLIIDIRGYNTREEALMAADSPVPAEGSPLHGHRAPWSRR
jgi:hypothetical protein